MTTTSGLVTVKFTPELRRLGLRYMESVAGWDAWLSYALHHTRDEFVLDAAASGEEAELIALIARAVLWEHGG